MHLCITSLARMLSRHTMARALSFVAENSIVLHHLTSVRYLNIYVRMRTMGDRKLATIKGDHILHCVYFFVPKGLWTRTLLHRAAINYVCRVHRNCGGVRGIVRHLGKGWVRVVRQANRMVQLGFVIEIYYPKRGIRPYWHQRVVYCTFWKEHFNS